MAPNLMPDLHTATALTCIFLGALLWIVFSSLCFFHVWLRSIAHKGGAAPPAKSSPL